MSRAVMLRHFNWFIATLVKIKGSAGFNIKKLRREDCRSEKLSGSFC